jgi:GntR family transcriptional regulator, transcriptional repressor for pyruvate dehydrogenase complex
VSPKTRSEDESRTDELSLAEKVTSQIRDWILNGTYGPGDKLPPERRLASLLGVNRGSLRLALKKLEQFGLLQSRQGDGTRVRDLSETAGIELLPFLFQTALSRQPEMLRDILELRVMVCTHLVRVAARKAKPSDLRRIQQIIEEMKSLDRDPLTLLGLDFDTYWEYARAGGSIVGQLLLNTVRGPFEQHSAPFLCMADEPALIIDTAQAISEAVGRHDAEEASKIAEAYLRLGADKALESYGLSSS